MRSFEVEKDKKVYLVIQAFHYLREGLGACDFLAVDYTGNMQLRLLTSTECKFIGFCNDIRQDPMEKLKGAEKPIIERTTIAEE
ncbi:MAG: hypothetical protein E3J78_03215 [Candidatus Cloacimonadota bacterium]|nr:MAG: hypothetical protein E3J78_03215 [Candidatus Cloacimonadota bacterium]